MEQSPITEFYSAFTSLLQEKQSIIVMSHMNPDDDSISSMLTLYSHIVTQFPEKKITLLYSGKKEIRWSYFENFQQIQFLDDSEIVFDSYDLFVGLDACQFSRFVKNTSLLESFKGSIVYIDHHPATPDRHDLAVVNPDYPACAELLYAIFFVERTFPSLRLAETILLGILGDTGTFKFINPKQTHVLLVAERLVREGQIDIQNLLSKYSTYSERTLFVMQELVRNISFKEIGAWPRLMYTFLDRAFVEENGLNESDISSASGIFVGMYGTSLTECSWSMVFTARQTGDVSVSMRSRPTSVNVRLVAQNMGKGGGHDRASAMKFKSENGVPVLTSTSIADVFTWLEHNSPDFS